MQLNWSTFILEIVNFLVLVWILKRFLYRPVTAALSRRRERIEQQLDEAARLKAEASEMQDRYEGRLASWEREKQEARDRLQQEMHRERQQRFERLEAELAGEREKAAVVDRRRLEDQRGRLQREAHARGARFAASLLRGVAGRDLEARLCELFIEALENIDQARGENLRRSAGEAIVVTSAFALSGNRRQDLEQVLCRILERDVAPAYREDASLLAGLRVTIGAWVLHLNLQDELQGFAELANESPLG